MNTNAEKGSGRLDGRVAVITGGGGGLGSAIASRFAEEGARIAAWDIDPGKARLTADRVEEMGQEATAIEVDVSDSGSVRAGLEQTLEALGQVDLLVNNAAINSYRRPFDFSDDEWKRIIDVNLTGVWNGCRYVGPALVEHGGGAIVNISSVAWFEVSYYRAPYMAAKGGVGNLTRALALDLAKSNVRVNAVAPGLMETGMTRPGEERLGVITREFGDWYTPMGRWAELREVANAALFLASDEAGYITGQTLAVDGGMSAGNPLGRSWPPSEED